MSYQLKLFYYPSCPFCVRVLKAIKKLEVADKITLANIHDDQDALTELISATQRRTVPCLFINQKPMHESLDIIDWLKTHQKEL